MLPENRESTHPGEILREDYLVPLGRSAEDLARHLGVPFAKLEAVLGATRPVDADLAWRLSMALGTSPEFWLSLQSAYDLTHHRPQRRLPLFAVS